jgi:hypothetical protein
MLEADLSGQPYVKSRHNAAHGGGDWPFTRLC